MNTWNERLTIARVSLTINKSQFAKGVGVSSPTVTDWESGAIQSLSAENLLKICNFLRISANWLMNGRGEMRDSSETDFLKLNKINDIEINQYHDVSGAMGAGVLLRDQPGQITGWRVTAEWLHKNIPHHSAKENLCIVTGFGDSMRGLFNSGDPLLIDCGIKELAYDAVYFFRIGEEGFIKRLQRVPGVGIRVISKNPDYETWTITDDMQFEIFGRVIKVWQGEAL